MQIQGMALFALSIGLLPLGGALEAQPSAEPGQGSSGCPSYRQGARAYAEGNVDEALARISHRD
jgi:hypothetical protein